MIKEQYKQQKEDYESEINAIKVKLKNIALRYIMDNQDFNIDDRIKITSPKTTGWGVGHNSKIEIPEKVKYAYVSGIVIDWQGDIEYKLMAEKKDGTRSLKTEYYSKGRDILELA